MAAILIIFALAAAVWALVYAWRGSLVLGSVASLLLGYALTNNYWRLGVGPVSLTVGRVLIAGLVVLLIWRWRQGLVERRPLAGSDWLVAMFVGYVALRYLFTSPAVGIASSISPTWRIISCFLMPALLYLVIRCGEFSKRNWKIIFASFSCFGVYLAATGIAEVAGQWWAVFPNYISDPTLGTHFGRARGPALNSMSLGMFLAVCFWAAWFLWSRVNRRWQFVLLGSMGLMCVAMYFTYTRSSWLAFAITLAGIPLLHVHRSWRPVLLTGMLVAGFFGAVFVGERMINLDRRDANGSASHSVYQRESFLIVSMRMFADDPLIGCGFGRFFDKKLPYLTDRSQQIELESIRDLDHHNTFLSVLTETGLIGLSLFIALLVAWGRVAWQLSRDATTERWIRAQGLFALAVLIIYAVNGMFHDLTLLPSEQWLLFLVAGSAVGMRGSLQCRSQNELESLRLPVESLHPRDSDLSIPHGTPQRAFPAVQTEGVRLFGITINAVDMPAAVGTVLDWCRAPRGDRCRYVVTPNVDHALIYQTSAALRQAYRGASLVLADGAPVVAASRLLRRALPERVAGSDLVPALFDAAKMSAKQGVTAPLRVFLLGAAPGVADRAAEQIHKRWPGVQVVGTLAPPLGFEHDEAENERILQKVADAEPDLVLIGLGAPKQELWVDRHADRLEAKAALCIGATIDFLAGEKNRSPRWMQQIGLEWFHRLASEPSRLSGRYLRNSWLFPQLVWREWLHGGLNPR